jgi:DNA-directed RNA polymerase subunit alpha
MGLPSVKEDVLEIILNLKQLRLHMFTEEEVKLELSVSGKKTVTAADIKKNSSVNIINPELKIAEITSSAGNLEMEIFIQPGRGYRLVEGSRKNAEIGYIEMDAIFSPILSVSISVDNVRVGKMTNWDKLILDVKTDGTITFEDAFKETVKILVDQFSALLGEQPAAPAPEIAVEAEAETTEKVEAEKSVKKERKSAKK